MNRKESDAVTGETTGEIQCKRDTEIRDNGSDTEMERGRSGEVQRGRHNDVRRMQGQRETETQMSRKERDTMTGETMGEMQPQNKRHG